MSVDRVNRLVDVVLYDGSGHRVEPGQPDKYSVQAFDEVVVSLDPDSVFPRAGPQRGYAELTIPQLRDEAERMRQQGLSPHTPIMEIHQKFSIPVACLVFAIIGLALGVTSRKDGRLASFVLGIGVIFAYYILLYGGKAMAKGHLVSPHLAPWLPNIVLGLVGLGLLLWRSRSVERRLTVPLFSGRRPPVDPAGAGR